MKCKYINKDCNDRYFSSNRGHCCRLAEWKRKKGVCPYDKKIFSKPRKIIKAIKDKKQKTLITL